MTVREPKNRSNLRLKLGGAYFSAQRKLRWLSMRKHFARERSGEDLSYQAFSHHTPLMRKLKDVDMQLQRNKVTNLRLACARLDGLLLRPGETMSYWYLIGKPTAGKGYLPGMILRNGGYLAATGGGLCQLSNLIYWMTLHTPLTVVERHRHGYDVFPDANRTQPFGSGATCFYPYLDLMIRNDTADDYQLLVAVGETDLEGDWRVSAEPTERYAVVERNHEMRAQYWGGYVRHNELYRQTFDLRDNLLAETPVAVNDAVMMYSPYLEESKRKADFCQPSFSLIPMFFPFLRPFPLLQALPTAASWRRSG